MKVRLRKFVSDLAETFWVLPAAMVAGGILLAMGLLAVDRYWLPKDTVSWWLYDGGGSGARALLGAVASSTIGVAGTIFSITIAALSLAAGQMGPRLLRNFTRDRGNQLTLGIFLGTFSYALMVLRSVRAEDEGAFIPHLSLSIAILLAFVCVAMVVFFVGHMAGRINVDTVIALVGQEIAGTVKRLAQDKPGDRPPSDAFWNDAVVLRDDRRGYLQHLDDQGLADWAETNQAPIWLLVRPGDYVFPGAAIALIKGEAEGAAAAVRAATALGTQRVSSADLEFAVRQLVEVAVRALSPGVNDPNTAISVLDRLGASLCEVAQVHLPTGVVLREGKPVLVRPSVDYAGLTDAMFHMIRQNAAGSPAVLIRMLDVLTAVIDVEQDPERRTELTSHADLVLGDGERTIETPGDREEIRRRHARFLAMRDDGPCNAIRPR